MSVPNLKRRPLQEAVNACRPALIACVGLSLFINLLMFVAPIYMLQVYDRVLTSRNEYTLVMLSIIAVGLLICHAVLEAIRAQTLSRTSVRFDVTISPDVFGKLGRSGNKVSETGRRQLIKDIGLIREAISGGVFATVCDIPWAPIFLLGCYLIHPWLGALALGGAVVIITIAVINEFWTRRVLAESAASRVANDAFAANVLGRSEVAQAMGMLPQLMRAWIDRNDETLNKQTHGGTVNGLLVATAKFVRMGLQIASLGLGAYLAVHQEITPGAIIAASIIMARALAPVDAALSQWRSFVAARTAYRRLETLFQNAPEDAERMVLPEPEGNLAVRNVALRAPGGTDYIFRGISFDVRAGETLAIVGPSAAGKSSLARCLVNVWQPSIGDIRLDGSALGHWNEEQLGRNIGYLPQEVELFAGTVEENIARFQKAEGKEIVRAARIAGVHDIIQRLPDGYDTTISDGGRELSGGQRQRIALARAVFGDPKLIVLDEPNANLDASGEEALAQAVASMKQTGSAIVLISHKPALVDVADRLLVMANGSARLHPRNPSQNIHPDIAVAAAE